MFKSIEKTPTNIEEIQEQKQTFPDDWSEDDDCDGDDCWDKEWDDFDWDFPREDDDEDEDDWIDWDDWDK